MGAKKTQKLGAKKLGGGDSLDFEAAEKKAKEEAERIEKLGYDPEAEQAAADSKIKSAGITEKTKIISPTPLSPGKSAGFGATQKQKRSDNEVERLGMGVARLGFGQTGGIKSAAPAPRKMGFGSVGTSKAVEEGMNYFRWPSVDTKSIQMMTSGMPVKSSALRKAFRPTNSLVKVPSILQRSRKRRVACKALREPRPSAQMRILADRKMIFPKQTSMATTVIWKVQQEISSENSG